MRFAPSDLATLADLVDEYVDLDEYQRSAWLHGAILRYPDLAVALTAMVGKPQRPPSLPPLSMATEADSDAGLPDFLPGEFIGPFRLLSKLGQGGMGVVWLAEQNDIHLTRTVALKLPLCQVAQRGLRQRFARERNILATLDHPGIAKLFDAGVTQDGQPYMAMQYVRGQSLTSYCDEHRFDVAQRLGLFIELLHAVQHAHSALVVHRDIKPGNIHVTDEGRVVLLDFGVAKMLETDSMPLSEGKQSEPHTEFSAVALTLDYASPEQVAKGPVGIRADIYSLGVVLYELLTGCRPYRLRRATRGALEEAVLEQEILPPSLRANDIDSQRCGTSRKALIRKLRGDLDAVVLKALAKKPESRYATAQEFANDIIHWLRKEPVSAQPDGFGYRFGRLLRRRWKTFTVAAAMTALLIAISTIAVIQAVEANRNSVLAEISSRNANDEARKSQAVTAFMKDLFNHNGIGQSDPQLARKRTAEELLDDGAKRIQTDLSGVPDQQLELMHVMSQMYSEMRMPERSIEIEERAISVAREAYGEKDPRTLAEISRLAYWGFGYGNPEVGEKALALVQPVLPELAASQDMGQRRVAASVYTGMLQRDVFGNVRESANIARQAQKVFANLPAEEFGWAPHHLIAVALYKNLMFGEAEANFVECARLKSLLSGVAVGDGSNFTWQAMLQESTGRYALAESNFRRGYSIERHGDADGDRVDTFGLANFARFLTNTAQAKEALLLTENGGDESNLYIRERLPKAARVLWAKANALVRLGKVEQGLALARHANELAIIKWGEKSARTRQPVEEIQGSLELGRLSDTQKLLESSLAGLKENNADKSIDSRNYWTKLVTLLLAEKRTDEAGMVLDQSRSVLVSPGSGLGDLANLDLLEATLEQQKNQHLKAQSRLEGILVRISGSPERTYLREWEARLQESLGVSLAALGNAVGAKSAFESALAQYQTIFDPTTSLSVGRVALRLSNLSMKTGDPAAAKKLQAQADRIRARHPQFEQWLL